MIKQKAIYNKDFNLIEYKEFHYGTLVKHERFDDRGNIIEQLYSDGRWMKFEFDVMNRCIYKESSYGDWTKYLYGYNGRVIHKELSNGYWCKYNYNAIGHLTEKITSSGIVLFNTF